MNGRFPEREFFDEVYEAPMVPLDIGAAQSLPAWLFCARRTDAGARGRAGAA